VRITLFAASLLAAGTMYASIAEIKAEPHVEKRAHLALANADIALTTAETKYQAGDRPGASAAIDEMKESVEIAEAALEGTHKNPRRSPKHFKFAETKSRDLLRRIDGFEKDMDLDDRKMIEPVRMRIQEVHDSWLLGILGKSK
jgi:hypothetical protein